MTNQSNPVTPTGIARWKSILLGMGICACIGAIFAVYTLIKEKQYSDDAEEQSAPSTEQREEPAPDNTMAVKVSPDVEEPVVEEPAALSTDNPLVISLAGKIGPSRVKRMEIRYDPYNSYQNIEGEYSYGYGTIHLSGSWDPDNNRVSFTEESQGNISGSCDGTLRVNGNGEAVLSGSFTNYKGHTYKVSLSGTAR